MWQQAVWLLAIDDFVLADANIPPAVLTNKSSQLGFGVERRAGISSSVFFGSAPTPATWNALFDCPDEASRQALISVLAAQGHRQFRLLAQRSQYGEDLITAEAAISGSLDERARGTIFVDFESNDSVWLAEDTATTSKSFTSTLDQAMHLDVPGNVPTNPVVRITPLAQRSVTTAYVGWKYRQRFAISNEGTDPLFREAVRIDLGSTTALVSGSKARSDGADVRVWLHGLEQSRTLVGWNTSSTALWVVVPVLPPRQSLTYDIVYGNPLATSADGVELTYPDLPAYDITASTNFLHLYRTGTDIAHAGEGLWFLSSSLEGGTADYGVPGAWQPALTFENPNNSDNVVQPRARRLAEDASEWYQAVPFAARWKGDSWDEEFQEYAGGDPFDGVTLYNPFGIRSVHADTFAYRNNSSKKTVVTTTVVDAVDPNLSSTESSEVLAPYDPPYTRAVAIGRNSGGEGWHVLAEYDGSTALATGEPGRLYLPSSGSAAIFPVFTSGWEYTTGADRIAATAVKGSTPQKVRYVTLGTTATNYDVLVRQYIYPLPAGVVFATTDTVKGQLRADESTAAADARAQMVIRVMTAASVVQATLLSFDTGVLSSEFSTSDSFQNRKFPRGGAVNLQANYTTVAGDYLVMEYGFRKHATSGATIGMGFGVTAASAGAGQALLEDEADVANHGYPWIEFSTDLTGSNPALAVDWTPPGPVKHFGLACWPARSMAIPDDVESRVSLAIESDMSVYIAAESLFITQVEAETEIYEMGTELRLQGGANAVGPYHALLVGNARQASGPGTPRAAVKVGTQALQIDAERRTHTVWDTDFTVQEEALPSHVVRALVGNLREVDATEIPSLSRIAATIPNATFTGNITGWESHSGGGGWSFTVAYDSTVGGAANGSLKFAIASSSAGTLLYRSSTYIAVQSGDSVELSAWMRQNESGSSSPRLGIAWYNATPTLLSTSLDQFYGVDFNPANDQALVMSAPVPAGATQCRVLIGVTEEGNVPATKWFDDVTLTIIRPQHYDAALAKVTDETRASRWLPLVPPRRQVVNGTFDTDISGWELYDDGTGITQAATHDPELGGDQDGSLQVVISANSGSDNVVYLNAQPFGINGQESETVAGWVRTSNVHLVPLLCIAWYTDPEDAPVSIATEDVWAPLVNTGYRRAFGAIAPPEADWFRVGVVIDTSSSATGSVWADDITLNDNDLLLSDVSPASLDVDVIVRPRFIP